MKILTMFENRQEAIKLAPVVKALKDRPDQNKRKGTSVKF